MQSLTIAQVMRLNIPPPVWIAISPMIYPHMPAELAGMGTSSMTTEAAMLRRKGIPTETFLPKRLTILPVKGRKNASGR